MTERIATKESERGAITPLNECGVEGTMSHVCVTAPLAGDQDDSRGGQRPSGKSRRTPEVAPSPIQEPLPGRDCNSNPDTSKEPKAKVRQSADRPPAASKTDNPVDGKGVSFVNMLTKTDREWQAEITQTISELATLRQCEDFLVTLESATTDGGVDIFDRGLGLKSWLQGAVLTRIKPLPKKDEHGKPVRRPRILLPKRNGKRMTLGEYVHERLPFSLSTAHWVRKSYDVFTFDEAGFLGYREMLSQLAPSFRKALSDGPPNTPNDANDDGETDFDGSAAGCSETTDTEDGEGEGGEGKRSKITPLAITQIPKKLDGISDLIDRMAAVPESPDRYNNVSRHLEILSDQQTRIDNLKVKLAALPAALERTRRDIKHWHEQGIEASHNKSAQKKGQPNDGEGSVR